MSRDSTSLAQTLRNSKWTNDSGSALRQCAAELKERTAKGLKLDTIGDQVVGALGHLRRVATQVENVAAARKTAAVTALFSLALVDDRRILAESLRCLVAFSNCPALHPHFGRAAASTQFNLLFQQIRLSMTKDRAVATATVSFVRALSCSLDSTVALVETEMGIELLTKIVQFWRDDSIATETCAAMRLLLESGARAQIMEPVAQQGGLLLLITMLRQEAPEVQGAACDALAAAFANGVQLDQLPETAQGLLQVISDMISSRWAAGSQQKSALNLLCMLCEHAGGSFRASVKKSGVLDAALELHKSNGLTRPATLLMCKILRIVGMEAKVPTAFKTDQDESLDDNDIKILQAQSQSSQQLTELKRELQVKAAKDAAVAAAKAAAKAGQKSSRRSTPRGRSTKEASQPKYPRLFSDDNPLSRVSISWGGVHHVHAEPPEGEPLGPVDPEYARQLTEDDKSRFLRELPINKEVYRRSAQPPPTEGYIAQPRFWNAGGKTLEFSSEFESGNLETATLVWEGQFEYDLTVTNDYNTSGHTQWYYFAVTNVVVGQEYTFNITNFEKSGSLYNDGMLPLVYSTELAEFSQTPLGWHRAGCKVAYYPAYGLLRPSGANYYKLTFSFTFTTSHDDVVYFANSVPYTFRDLRTDLVELREQKERAGLIEWYSLAETLGGIKADMIMVRDDSPGTEPVESRPMIVFSGRVHPGETNASWMIRGVLNWLTNPTCANAVAMRRKYCVLVIPMLNPDGVILGNYRCSKAGLDLNRQWQKPSKRVTPTVHALKNLLRANQNRVVFYCDLHGHSRKYDSFMYGCKNQSHRRERMVPWLLGQIEPFFSYNGSSFKVSKSKAGTGRVVGWREFGLVNCFTLEASFAGSRVHHFRTEDYERIGASLCEAVHQWSLIQGCYEQREALENTIASYHKNRRKGSASDLMSDSCVESDDSGSSAGSDGEPEPEDPQTLQERWEEMHVDPAAVDEEAAAADAEPAAEAAVAAAPAPRSKSSSGSRRSKSSARSEKSKSFSEKDSCKRPTSASATKRPKSTNPDKRRGGSQPRRARQQMVTKRPSSAANVNMLVYDRDTDPMWVGRSQVQQQKRKPRESGGFLLALKQHDGELQVRKFAGQQPEPKSPVRPHSSSMVDELRHEVRVDARLDARFERRDGRLPASWLHDAHSRPRNESSLSPAPIPPAPLDTRQLWEAVMDAIPPAIQPTSVFPARSSVSSNGARPSVRSAASRRLPQAEPHRHGRPGAASPTSHGFSTLYSQTKSREGKQTKGRERNGISGRLVMSSPFQQSAQPGYHEFAEHPSANCERLALGAGENILDAVSRRSQAHKSTLQGSHGLGAAVVATVSNNFARTSSTSPRSLIRISMRDTNNSL